MSPNASRRGLHVDYLLTVFSAGMTVLGVWTWVAKGAPPWTALIFGATTLFFLYFPRLEASARARTKAMNTVQIDAWGVTRKLPGKVERVGWNELREVRILTTSDGPFAEDVFFVLIGDGENGCVVPHGLAEEARLLEHLQERLDGFDNTTTVVAMGSTGDALFTIWTRENEAV